jgi:hypothetical protein
LAEVPLVDLEVIVRYSLAIRQEVAPAEEVLAALDESRALVLALMDGRDPDEDEDGEEAEEERAQDLVPPAEAPAHDLDDEIEAAEDQVALDDLDDSGAEVDGTPGLDPEPPPVRRSRLRPAARTAADRPVPDLEEEPEADPERRPLRRSRLRPAPSRQAEPAALDDTAFQPEPARPARPPQPPPQVEEVRDVEEDEEDWVDEMERIRLRRMRRARREAEERQARQVELSVKAKREKAERLAEEARREEQAWRAEQDEHAAQDARDDAADEEEEARRAQQARRAQGSRLDRDAPRDDPPRRRVGTSTHTRSDRSVRGPSAPPERAALDDALELPQPLPADEAAKRREERRRRRERLNGQR